MSETFSRGPVDWRRAAVATSDARTLSRMIDEAAKRGEDEIGAWQVLDPETTLVQVENLMARGDWRNLPLAGVPVGVKDIFDTADFVTSYGSEIYAGHRPAADAAAVAALRRAGAILPGKTVTTEFAYWKAGKTRNPHNTSHSPGGSSAGSAAAVAAGMVPLAIGSQTAASTIRPASYCGIVGFKPSLHRISLAGVKGLAGSMDTVGCFAGSVADVSMLAAVLAGRPDWTVSAGQGNAPCLRLTMAPEWELAAPWMRDSIHRIAEHLAAGGARVSTGRAPDRFADLAGVQSRLMAAEAARDLAEAASLHRDHLSAPLQDLIELGESMPPAQQDADYATRDDALAHICQLFDGADILIAPSALDEAPHYGDGTGSPELSRAWTLLGLPSISLPAGRGPKGLPFGVQLAALPGKDSYLLDAARWVEANLPDPAHNDQA